MVVVNRPEKKESHNDINADLQVLLDMGLTKSDASKVLAKARGLKKNDVYKNSHMLF